MAATLSVVVPVYGTKRDLPACLESLRTQSLRDAEFLLVDDASPDGAGAVLAEYARARQPLSGADAFAEPRAFRGADDRRGRGDGQVPRFSGQR